MTNQEKALKMHEEWNGKLETIAKSHVKTREDLAIAYTPGVAEPCKVIAEDKEAAYKYTIKSNTIAVVSDGSAVLGLGNIGPLAAMPVMEGKAVLFKEFGGVNAVPICLDTQDTEEIDESTILDSEIPDDPEEVVAIIKSIKDYDIRCEYALKANDKFDGNDEASLKWADLIYPYWENILEKTDIEE